MSRSSVAIDNILSFLDRIAERSIPGWDRIGKRSELSDDPSIPSPRPFGPPPSGGVVDPGLRRALGDGLFSGAAARRDPLLESWPFPGTGNPGRHDGLFRAE